MDIEEYACLFVHEHTRSVLYSFMGPDEDGKRGAPGLTFHQRSRWRWTERLVLRPHTNGTLALVG